MVSRKAALLAVLSLLVLSVATGSGAFGSRFAVFAQSGNSSTQPTPPTCGLNPGNPCGQPSFANLTAWGNALAIMIEQTAQFKALANGTTYHIDQYSSFGYEWGPTIPSEEIITFFSPNRLATIQTYVITAPVGGTTTVSSSQIAAASSTGVNSTSGLSLNMDLKLNLNGSSYSGPAQSFDPIVVSMLFGNETGFSSDSGGFSVSNDSGPWSTYWPYLVALSLGAALVVTGLAFVHHVRRRSTSPRQAPETKAANYKNFL